MLPPRPQGSHSSSASTHPDDAIRLTDDDAASSRLSATQTGYLSDPFVSLLYKPPMTPSYGPSAGPTGPRRKSPLINIGTHHRMWGIDLLVDKFLAEVGEGGGQVVSLGAGSDTRFWRLMSRSTPPNIAKYVEIDFPHLTSPKAQRIARSRKLSQYLFNRTSPPTPTSTQPFQPPPQPYTVSQGGTQLSSELYALIPLDLRPSPSNPSVTISQHLTSTILPHLEAGKPTLFLAECLFPYMPPEDSREVIRWFGETFARCVGVVYEMVGLDDSFGKVMRRNLASRNLEIPGSAPFSTPQSQAERFLAPELGESGKFDKAGARTLWQVREEVIAPEELQRISKLEILDEIEELRLVLGHYVIAWGSKGEGMGSVQL
ncbi:hypothetical protein IAT38_000575 [Cryptococcus sp. DSM 104549]